jgi:4-hydroxybenzoyl-CoA thioesterase
MTDAPRVHRLAIPIRFGVADPVGIAYFPRYFDWFHQAMETWFDQCLGVPYAEVLKKNGLPTVETHCQYRRPCRFGETVSVELRVGELGRSSILLKYRVIGVEGELRTEAWNRVVWMDTDPSSPSYFRPLPIPEDLRAKMVPFLEAPPSP